MGDWSDVLTGRKKGAQKKMQETAIASIASAASDASSHEGKAITKEEMIAILQSLNATGGAAAFNAGDMSSFVAALEQALANWSEYLNVTLEAANP